MKQSVSPAIMAVVIIAVVAVVAFIGFKVFGPSESGTPTAEMNKKYNPSGGPAGPAMNSNHPPAGVTPSSGYHGSMAGVGQGRPPGR